MDTIALPDTLHIESQSNIATYLYKSNQEIEKQQIVLNKNTFSFLLKGTKEVFFNNAAHAINNSQFLLMKSGHCLMTEKLSNTENYYSSLLLFFDDELVLNFIKKFDITLKKPKQPYATYSFKYDDFINRFVKSVLDISKLSKNTQSYMLQAKFDEIMLYLIELNGVDFIFSLIETNNTNHSFIETVESNQLKKLTIKELAFLCNMSTSTFKRTFEKHYNTSPSKWFLDKRLEYAAFLLKEKAKRPSEIYDEIGYESLSNFIHAFKAKFGVTPKQHQSE